MTPRFTACVDRLIPACSKAIGCSASTRWSCSNRLQLNALKTELIWCALERRLQLIPNPYVKVGHDSVQPVQSARDLGVYVDGGITMKIHINHMLSSCYSELGQIIYVKRSLPAHALNTLVTALVQPIGLLQRCIRWSSKLWNSTSAVSPQHSRVPGCRRIEIRSRDSSVAWSPLASCPSVCWIQAAHECSSLLVRRRTNLLWSTSSRRLPLQLPEPVSDLPCQVLSRCHVQCHHQATAHSQRPAHVRGTGCRYHFVNFTLLTVLNAIWKHFYLISCFICALLGVLAVFRTYVALVLTY